MRTIQTSNIINKYHNVKIIKDEAITEMDQGIFTARKYKILTELEKKQRHERSKITKMESFEHGYNRALCFVNKIKNEYKNKDILVVTHNNIASFIELIALNKKVDFNNREQMSNFKNAELKHFVIWSVLKVNYFKRFLIILFGKYCSLFSIIICHFFYYDVECRSIFF